MLNVGGSVVQSEAYTDEARQPKSPLLASLASSHVHVYSLGPFHPTWSSLVSSRKTGGMYSERRSSSAMMALPRETSLRMVCPHVFSSARKSSAIAVP